MADNSPASDRSLLERLNALKPTSVNLSDPSSSKTKTVSSIDTIERAKPPSREDNLTARLKSLRNQVSESSISTPSKDASKLPNHGPTNVTAQPQNVARGVDAEPRVVSGPAVPQTTVAEEDVDPLLFTDDQTLEELLQDLRSDDTWLDEVAAQEEEHQRVTALLDELGKTPPDTDGGNDDGGSSSDDDDDSDGEPMAKETETVLTKALDEVEWERKNKNKPPSPTPRSASAAGGEDVPMHDAADDSQSGTSKAPHGEGDALQLPGVPSKLPDATSLSSSSSSSDQSDSDFTASIASRMAALKLSGKRALPSVPSVEVDELGLPLAPTFAPVATPRRGMGGGDADQKTTTWCVVCLEDGAVRCLGCDPGDDVYCARCWKEMHVGPRAGYEERGHAWETFVASGRGR
ncbi:hypothetical protein F5Y17DRAFT_436707 [Xylariaceae sp. FL0594]|nr:hypothetical protein F5Y17DRAFT_436707 [Xylariaceae sp. FL0594]